ncbi:MAG: AAA family ATPase [Alphaproteobacteria bacterium]|nr:AAA family ATPase [Alphaproteobacteria bacterium]
MTDTKILAVICRKGGVGKTMLATHLAVAAQNLGLITAVLDLDPQANSAMWGDNRGSDAQPAVVAAQANRLPVFIKQAQEQDADLLILDTPPHADTTATAAAQAADLLLIPTRPSGPDLDALPASIHLARTSGKPFFVVLNAAPVQGSEVNDATHGLEAEGIEVSPVVLHHRKAFSSHWQQGMTAEEADPDGKAAAEIRALMLWLAERLGLMQPERQSHLKIA